MLPVTQKGEYVVSFAYRIMDMPGHDEESIKIYCGDKEIEFSDYELTYYATLQENIAPKGFTWLPSQVCILEEGVNKLVVESTGADAVHIAAFRYTKYNSRCNLETCNCEDRLNCMDSDGGIDEFRIIIK